MLRMFLLFLAAMLTVRASCAEAGSGPGSPGNAAAAGAVLDLSLRDLVHATVERNASLLSERLRRQSSGHRVEYERAIFLPEFSAKLNYESINIPNNTSELLTRGGLETHDEEEWTGRAGFRGLLPTGAVWDLGYVQTRSTSSLIDSIRAYTSEYESQVRLDVRQPLLRGFGSDIVLAQYDKARWDADLQERAVESLAMDLVAHAIREYWKLYGAQDLIRNLAASIELLKESEELLKKRVEAGDVAEEQLLEARSSRLSREVELQMMRSNSDQSKYAIMTLLNLDLAEQGDPALVVSGEDVGADASPSDFDSAFAAMKANWPQFQAAEARVERAKVELREAEDAARPALDLVLSGWLSDLDDDFIEERAVNDDFPSWSVGLELVVPLSARRARHAVAAAATDLRQAETELRYLERSAMLELRSLYRTVNASTEQLEVMRAANELKKQLFEEEFKRFKFGEINIGDVILKEDEVNLYQRKVVNQVITNKVNQVNLDRLTGVLLAKYGVADKVLEAEIPSDIAPTLQASVPGEAP